MALIDTVFPHSAFKAISDGDLETFKRLLRQSESCVGKVRSEDGESLLHKAARAKGKGVAIAMCEALLEFGLSPHIATEYGRTPLHEAVRCRVFNKDVAHMLRSSMNDRDSGGCTALMFAAEGAGLFGSRRGNSAIAQELLALDADPLICDESGKTALGYAMQSNDTDRNGDMIALLQDAMLRAAALREFEERYSCAFDKNGVMKCEPRAGK